jgi:hypothetical protein
MHEIDLEHRIRRRLVDKHVLGLRTAMTPVTATA